MEPNNTQDEASNLFRITNTKVIGLLAAALIFVVTYIVTSVVNSPHNRIDKLVAELEHLHETVNDLEYDIAQTERNDIECKDQNIEQYRQIRELRAMGNECVNWRNKAEAEIKQLGNFYDWYLKTHMTD